MNTDRIIIVKNDQSRYEVEFEYLVINDANYQVIAGFDSREDAELFIKALGEQE